MRTFLIVLFIAAIAFAGIRALVSGAQSLQHHKHQTEEAMKQF